MHIPPGNSIEALGGLNACVRRARAVSRKPPCTSYAEVDNRDTAYRCHGHDIGPKGVPRTSSGKRERTLKGSALHSTEESRNSSLPLCALRQALLIVSAGPAKRLCGMRAGCCDVSRAMFTPSTARLHWTAPVGTCESHCDAATLFEIGCCGETNKTRCRFLAAYGSRSTELRPRESVGARPLSSKACAHRGEQGAATVQRRPPADRTLATCITRAASVLRRPCSMAAAARCDRQVGHPRHRSRWETREHGPGPGCA